jgi:hypothetical protein
VKRCETCRFWGWPGDEPLYGDDRRSCVVFSDWPGIFVSEPEVERLPHALAHVVPFAGADGGGLDTEADFGCVQWEAT